MKMNKVLLSLALAGVCFSQASAQIPHSSPTPAARQISDGVRSIGDTGRSLDPSEDLRPMEFQVEPAKIDRPKPQARTVSHSRSLGTVAPTTFASCAPANNNKRWFTAETLLWFADGLQTPVLATTSGAGVAPVAGAAGVTNAFGGPDGVESGLLPGYRLSMGKYFGDCDTFGVGGRVFGLYGGGDSFSQSSDGSTSLGVPFFDPTIDTNSVYNIGFSNSPVDPVAAGSLNADVDLDMLTAEGSFYVLLGKSSNSRVDLLAGYTYSNLRNSVALGTQYTDLDTGNLVLDGTVFTTNDLFDTENIFHGAHLGVLSNVTHRRVNLSTLAKISFGNMRQTLNVSGSTVENDGVTVTNRNGGLFAQASNIGSASRDNFAFIPEMGIKLGYNARENLDFTLGYTFLLYSSVALAGEQMDDTLELGQVFGVAGTRPGSMFNDSAFWLQGIDLGVNWTF